MNKIIKTLTFIGSKIFFFSIIFLLSNHVFANKNIISNQFSGQKLQFEIAEIINHNSKISIEEEISNLKFEKYESNKILIPDKEYWLKFEINTNQLSNSDQNIDLFSLFNYHAEIYLLDETSSKWKKINNNGLLNSKQTTHSFSKKILEIPLNKHKHNFAIRLKTRVVTSIIFMLSNSEIVIKIESFINLYIGFLLGFFYFVLFFSLITYLFQKEKLYLLYFFYILSITFYIILNVSNVGEILYQNRHDYIYHSFFTVCYLIVLMLSTRNYTNSFYDFPFLDRLVFWFILVRIVLFCLSFIFSIPIFNNMNLEVLCLGLCIYMSYLKYKKGSRPAFYFMLSCIVLSISFFLRANFNENNYFVSFLSLIIDIDHLPFIEFYYDGIYFTFFAFVIDVVLFTIGITKSIQAEKEAYKIQQIQTIDLRNEIIEIKDKHNYELELEIQKRIKDLNESYQQLHQLNDYLLIDNQNLNSTIKTLNDTRVMTKNISFEEFILKFQDNETCLKYIADVKWKNGFVCKKCKYKKYYSGDLQFARKCKLCQTKETPTADTLLFNVKFSIQKAMYIVYLIHDSDKINIKTISELLDLRYATCLKFSNKVLEAKLTLRNNKKEIPDWTSLLFVNNQS